MPDKSSTLTAYRHKRLPRKKKPAAPDVPAVVRRVTPGNDNRADPERAQRPTIVTTTSRKRAKLLHAALWVEQDDDSEVVAQVEAFFARIIRPADA